MLTDVNEDIQKAYNLLEALSQDKNHRMAYEARVAEFMDQRSSLLSAETKGREEGKKEGVRRVAENMLSRGMSVDDVADITGMDRNTLAGLQKQTQSEQQG